MSLPIISSVLASYRFDGVGDPIAFLETMNAAFADELRSAAQTDKKALASRIDQLKLVDRAQLILGRAETIDGGAALILGASLAEGADLKGTVASLGLSLTTAERYYISSSTTSGSTTTTTPKHLATATEATTAEGGTLVSSTNGVEVRTVGQTTYTLYKDEKRHTASSTNVATLSATLAAMEAELATEMTPLIARLKSLTDAVVVAQKEERKPFSKMRKEEGERMEAKIAEVKVDAQMPRARRGEPG